MQKNIYSLVLSENVVEAVDRLARARHTSRSNLINQILAEYVSYTTPEKRMQEIFSRMDALLSQREAFQVLAQPSASVFQLRSALAYKYNPTVRYHVELYRQTGPAVGELRVSLRTQNNTLVLQMLQFFKLWARIEHSFRLDAECAVEDGRFLKKLSLPEEADPDRLAAAISDYLNAFDGAMKAFFYQLDRPAEAVAQVEQLYRDYLRGCAFPL